MIDCMGREMDRVFDYVDGHASEYVRNLQALVRQPSISARGEGIAETAEMVRDALGAIGAEVEVLRMEGAAPLICAEIAGESSRTILFYNHYDVQPPEPMEAWRHGPFAAEIDGGRVYGRGTADNKGDLLARINAVDALRRAAGSLPATVKFVVEGEEEVGSPNLESYASRHPERFRADACIWETGGRDREGRLEITLGCKGLCYAQLEAEGAAYDRHSSLAGVVPNPAWRLVWALASLKNDREEIMIPGFYDAVRRPSDEEVGFVDRLPASKDPAAGLGDVGDLVLGLSGRDAARRLYFEPTCNICGLSSGYEGPGSKTVLPSRAMAKVDMRLVPDQDPDDIARKFEAYLASRGFGDIRVTWLGKERPARTDPGARIVKVVREAIREFYGWEPGILPTSTGTGPLYHVATRFGVPSVGVGIGGPESRVHGPDENVRIADYLEGIKWMANVIAHFAR